jgi:toxin CptA
MFPLPIEVTVRPSLNLRLGLAGLHALAIASLCMADLPPSWQIAGSLLLALSLIYYIRPHTPLSVKAGLDGNLELKLHGRWQQVEVLPQKIVLPALTVVRYRPPHRSRTQSLVITSDSLAADDFRRLRVWLRWRHGKSPKSQQGHDH